MKTHDEQPPQTNAKADDEAAPFGGTWTTLYIVVLVVLVILINLFHQFTRAFS